MADWNTYKETKEGHEFYAKGVHVRVWEDTEAGSWCFWISMEDAGPHKNGVIEGYKDDIGDVFTLIEKLLAMEDIQIPIPTEFIEEVVARDAD